MTIHRNKEAQGISEIDTPGLCPYCGSEEIIYGEPDLTESGDAMSYRFKCDKSGKESKEWYDLRYTGTVGIE